MNAGQVQLSVGGILLDIEGSSGIIDEIAFSANSIDVTVSASQEIKISSADRRVLDVTGHNTYCPTSQTCDSSKSLITIKIPSSFVGQTTCTITVKSETCIVSGGGGGSPGGVGISTPSPGLKDVVSPPPLPKKEKKEKEKKEEKELPGVPPGEIPPPVFPLSLPLGPISAPPFGPPPPAAAPEPKIKRPPTSPLSPIVETVIETIQKITEPIIETIQKITEPIIETIQDITEPVVKVAKKIQETVVETIKIIPKVPEAIQEISKGIVEVAKSITIGGGVPEAEKVIQDLRSNSIVTKTIKNVIEPVLIFIGAIGTALLTLTAVQASAALAIQSVALVQFLDLSRFFSLGLLQFRKRKPWGRVLEKLTGKPVPASLVQVYDSEFKKLKDSQLTDKDGRFGSLVGPGKYFIVVTKNGFQDKETATVTVDKPDQVLNLEIIISPIEQILSLDYLKRINLMDVIKRFLDSVSPILLIIGALLSFIALVIIPSLLNYIVFSIYILLGILKLFFAFHFVKPFGRVLDTVSAKPLSLAVIRIFDEGKQMLLATKATDEEGRFNFLIAPGKYYLTCLKAGYTPFRSSPISVTKASLETMDIKLQKIQPAPASPPAPPSVDGPTSPTPPPSPPSPPPTTPPTTPTF